MYDDKNVSRETDAERFPVKSEPLPEFRSKENEGFKMIANTPKIL
jgi:hypothetical protein